MPCLFAIQSSAPNPNSRSLLELVKIFVSLLCVLSLESLVCAQPLPDSPGAPDTNSPTSDAYRTEMMLRRLREAMTNPATVKRDPQPLTAPSATPSHGTAEAVVPVQTPPAQTAPSMAAPTTQTPAPTPSDRAPGLRIPDTATPAIPGAPVNRAANPAGTATQQTTVPSPTRTPAPRQQAPVNAQLNPGGPGVPPPGAPLPLPGNAPAGAQPRADLSAVAPALDPNEVIPTIQIQGMEPDQFFEIYSQISGRTVIRTWTLPNLQKITLKAATDLTRREAIFAMDSVLAQNQIAMIPIGEKFVKAVPSQLAAVEGAAPSKVVAGGDYADAEPFITQVVELKVVKPTDLQQLLTTFTKSPQGITAFDATQTLVIRDYASNVKRMLEVIKTVDVSPREPDYHLEAIPVKYGKVIDLYNTMQSLISGGGAAAGSPSVSQSGGQFQSSRSGSSRYGGSSSRYGGSSSYGNNYGNSGRNYGGYNSGGGVYPYEESVEWLGPMQAATPTPTTATAGRTSVGGAQSSFQNRLNQIVRRAASSGSADEVPVMEDARIVPDERSNKLLVFANRRDMEMITNIVSKVDVLLAQVLIEAIIMEVRLGDSQKLGISWAQRPKSFGSGSSGAGGINNGQSFLNGVTNFPGGLGQGLSYFGAINNQWDVAINAIAENSSVNVVSRPRIQTSHAISGSFFVGETVPYITGVTDYGGYVGNSGLTSRSQVQQANVGFSLYVTPFITPEGLVVMEISQEFSTRGRDVLIDENPIPIINGRNAESTLTVRDGDTIMMGGFITESRTKGKSGVPLLKDIPGLGALFRSKNTSNDRTELIVLMRARVLKTPEDAAIIASDERADLPGIYQAENELKEADKKRKDKAAKAKR